MNSSLYPGQANRYWKVAMVLGCVLLLVFGVTVQAAHVHSAADSSHANCTLCASAHVVVSPTVPITAPLAARQTSFPVLTPEPAVARRFPYFSLYTRPPPARIALA